VREKATRGPLDNITAYGFVIPTEVEESQLPG